MHFLWRLVALHDSSSLYTTFELLGLIEALHFICKRSRERLEGLGEACVRYVALTTTVLSPDLHLLTKSLMTVFIYPTNPPGAACWAPPAQFAYLDQLVLRGSPGPFGRHVRSPSA